MSDTPIRQDKPQGDARRQLRDAADDAADKIAAFFLEALEAEKTYTKRVRCPCKRTHDVEFSLPDYNARAQAVDKLLQYGYGRPAQQREEPKPQPVGNINKATDQELEALLLAQPGPTAGSVPGVTRQWISRVLEKR